MGFQNFVVSNKILPPPKKKKNDYLHGKKFFSKVDLKDAFLQIPVHPDDIHKTTITTPFGAFQHHYMPFGLSGASKSFQRFIDSALRDITVTYPNGITKEITVFVYVDDILLASDSDESHLVELKALFTWLTDNGKQISPLKCEFGKQSLEFLGHQINIDGTEPLPEKVAAMRNYEKAENAKGLRRYLGMINLYTAGSCRTVQRH